MSSLSKYRWTNIFFLFGTFFTTIIGMPIYIWHYGIDLFQISLFLFFAIATGMSITLGYHRLFSHLTFKASLPVKLTTLLFGAAAFEGSAMGWCADHRRHHKHVDHDEDPYDISKGLFHAHIGWLLFRTGPETPLTWVRDLQRDPLVAWQHKHFVAIAMIMSFVVPPAIGFLWGGWVAALGAFLIAGVARVVVVHHMTFCINSLCHWIGSRPYSSKISARDSFLMAIFTFGEGYHNYHHEFQYDYRNGVKPWQWDPTKWMIWVLRAVGLVKDLRTVPQERIIRAEIQEQKIRLQQQLAKKGHTISESLHEVVVTAQHKLDEALVRWEKVLADYRHAAANRSRANRHERRALKSQLREAADELRQALDNWRTNLSNCFMVAE